MVGEAKAQALGAAGIDVLATGRERDAAGPPSRSNGRAALEHREAVALSVTADGVEAL